MMPPPTWPAAMAEMPMTAGSNTCTCMVILVMILLCHLKTYRNKMPIAKLTKALMASQAAALLMKCDTLKSCAGSFCAKVNSLCPDGQWSGLFTPSSLVSSAKLRFLQRGQQPYFAGEAPKTAHERAAGHGGNAGQ